MVDSLRLTVVGVDLPMRIEFAHARARRSSSQNVVVVLRAADAVGVGECVPRDYVTGESVDTAFAAIAAMDLSVLERVFSAPSFESGVVALAQQDLAARLALDARPSPAAACAVEIAALDWLGQTHQRPLSAAVAALGVPATMLRAADALAPPATRALDFARPIDEFIAAVRRSTKRLHVKVKVGLSREEDTARLRAVRDGVGPQRSISVDANMAWSLDEAATRIELFRPFDVAWYEEPLPRGEFDAYRALRMRTGASVMLDESVTSVADGRRALAERAADSFNLRLSKCGGFLPCVTLAQLAHDAGLGYQLGVQIGQTGILEAAGRHLLQVLGGVVASEHADFFEVDLVAREEGRFGLGVVLDEQALARFTTRSNTIA